LPAAGLIRFVLGPDDRVFADLKHKLPGRGVWVTARRDVVLEAVKRRHFARAFKADVNVPDTLVDDIAASLRDDLRQGLSLRYSPAVVNNMLEKQLVETGIATVNLYDNTADINKRHNLSDAYPQRTAVKDSLRSLSDAATKDTSRPAHTVYFLQQAKP